MSAEGGPGIWRFYLPVDCPICGRRRLGYHVTSEGAVNAVWCEKCEHFEGLEETRKRLPGAHDE